MESRLGLLLNATYQPPFRMRLFTTPMGQKAQPVVANPAHKPRPLPFRQSNSLFCNYLQNAVRGRPFPPITATLVHPPSVESFK